MIIEDKAIYLLDFLDEKLFDLPELKVIFKFILLKAKKTLEVPGYDNLLFTCGGIFLKEDEYTEFKESIVKYINEIRSLKVDKNEVKSMIEDFIRAQELRKLQLEMSEDILQGIYRVPDYLGNLESLASLDLKRGDEIVYSKYAGEKIEMRERIPTCFNTLNKWLEGGIEKGEVGIFLGQANVGKSYMLVNLIPPSIDKSKNTVYLAFEIAKEHVKKRIDNLVFQYKLSRVEKDFLTLKSDMQKKKKGEVIIKEYPPYSVSVFELKGYLHYIKNTHGINTDLLLVDALIHLKPVRWVSNDWRNLANIVNELRGLAKKEDIAIWTVAHIRKEAFYQDFTEEDVARSIELINVPDAAFGLITKRGDKHLYLKPLKIRRAPKPKNQIKLEVDFRKSKMREIDES